MPSPNYLLENQKQLSSATIDNGAKQSLTEKIAYAQRSCGPGRHLTLEDTFMTRHEFDHFCDEVRLRGFDSVKTNAGVLPLDQWRPYGIFDGCNPSIEKYLKGFEWVPPNRAVDLPLDPPSPRNLLLGLWTFFRTQGPTLTKGCTAAAPLSIEVDGLRPSPTV